MRKVQMEFFTNLFLVLMNLNIGDYLCEGRKNYFNVQKSGGHPKLSRGFSSQKFYET